MCGKKMIEIINLCKSFGSVVAVDGLSITIRKGELFGLLGPNGAGKTTAVRNICGLLRADAGSVQIAGKPPTDLSVRKKIGLAPQNLALYMDLSAEENLTFLARLYGLSGSRLRQRTDWCLDFAGLQPRRRDRVKTYSGGMQRRLNLAAALMHDPSILVLDEPTVGVDTQSRTAILESILTLRDRGCTILYTTHYMEEAQRLCDRVGIMDHGKLLALDTVGELIQAHGGKALIVLERGGNEERLTTDDPLDALSQLDWEDRPERLRIEPASLESVFLNLTGRGLRD
ncbi:MAG: ABC transporter ATP-binding protein [Phycisphaerales bacterium]|nr:MAG: ABC transporter ATP-binding protein [Phycisphaerales bacterium]